MVEIEGYYIYKGKLDSPQYLTEKNKWSNDLRKAKSFDDVKDAEFYYKASKLRSGQIGYWEGETIITKNGCMYNSEFKKL